MAIHYLGAYDWRTNSPCRRSALGNDGPWPLQRGLQVPGRRQHQPPAVRMGLRHRQGLVEDKSRWTRCCVRNYEYIYEQHIRFVFQNSQRWTWFLAITCLNLFFDYFYTYIQPHTAPHILWIMESFHDILLSASKSLDVFIIIIIISNVRNNA